MYSEIFLVKVETGVMFCWRYPSAATLCYHSVSSVTLSYRVFTPRGILHQSGVTAICYSEVA